MIDMGRLSAALVRECAIDLGGFMKRFVLAAIAAITMSTAAYADTIKVGVVGPFSGPFALQGKNFKAGIDAYIATNGNKVGDNTVEIIYRDLPAADPAQSKALAQELVVKEKVQYLAGFYFTPDAMAVTPILKQANTPLVIMNAATSAIVTKSPLVVRTSFTTWQTSTPIAKVAHDAGVTKAISVVSDYGPGVDAENAFKAAFEKEGGRSSKRSACRSPPTISARSCSASRIPARRACSLSCPQARRHSAS